MSDRAWRDRFFNGRRDAITRAGLVRAPVRETMSHEMAAAVELDQREVEHERAIYQRLADETRELYRRRRIDELRPLVEEFGPDAVTRISRRADPKFELPVELREDEQ